MNILPIIDQESGQSVTDKLNAVFDVINALEEDYIKKTGTGLTDLISGDFWIDNNLPTRFMTDDGDFQNGLFFYGSAGSSLLSQNKDDDSYAGVFVADGNRVQLQSKNYTDDLNVLLELTNEEFNITSGNPFFKGLQGDADYWVFSDSQTFIQRGYVDNNFLPYTGAENDFDLGAYSMYAEGIHAQEINTVEFHAEDITADWILDNSSGANVMDIANRRMYDASGTQASVDFDGRFLYSQDGSDVLSWDNGGVNILKKITFPSNGIAQLNISSVGAITGTSNGDIWRDGNDIKINISGVVKKFTLV